MSSTSTKILIAALAIVATSLTAQAADLKMKPKAPIYKAPPMPVAVVNDWSGFYIGAHVGYGWADTVSTGVLGAPFGLAPGTSVGV